MSFRFLDVNNPRVEAADTTVPLRGDDDGLCSFQLNLSADGYAGKELAMNTVASAQGCTGGWVTSTSAALKS